MHPSAADTPSSPRDSPRILMSSNIRVPLNRAPPADTGVNFEAHTSTKSRCPVPNRHDSKYVNHGCGGLPSPDEIQPILTATQPLHKPSQVLKRNASCLEIARITGNETGPKNRKYAGGRGAAYSCTEVDRLLGVLEKKQPICAEEWEVVQRKLQQHYPDGSRTVNSLKRKFSSLYRAQKNSGNADIPPVNLRAKKIRMMMTERAETLAIKKAKEIARDSNGEGSLQSQKIEGCTGDIPYDGSDLEDNENGPNVLNASPAKMRRRNETHETGSVDEILQAVKKYIVQEEKRCAAEHERRTQNRLERRAKSSQGRMEERARRLQEREEERQRGETERFWLEEGRKRRATFMQEVMMLVDKTS